MLIITEEFRKKPNLFNTVTDLIMEIVKDADVQSTIYDFQWSRWWLSLLMDESLLDIILFIWMHQFMPAVCT